MAYQNNFKRYELKYLLTLEEKQKILQAMALHMQLDQFGREAIIKSLSNFTDATKSL